MDQRIRRTAGHVIVCGYGRVGRQAVEELRRDRQTVVIVDADEGVLADAARDGLPVIDGDATEVETATRCSRHPSTCASAMATASPRSAASRISHRSSKRAPCRLHARLLSQPQANQH